MKKILFVIVCIFFLSTGCFRRQYKKPVIKGYYLYAYATDEDMCIMHFDKFGGLEIVGPTVFSIGYDTNFIIAKQHPTIYPEKENKSITNYFIISLKDTVMWTAKSNAIGPLNEKEFLAERKKLNVADTLNFFSTFSSVQ
jgi:hypothetical protein